MSCIVTLFNSEHRVLPLLRILSGLDYPNYEVLIVDDASEDATSGLVDDFLLAYSGSARFDFVRNESNQGVSFSRNRGIELSAGEILVFFDDDDLPDPGRVTCHARALTPEIGSLAIHFVSSTKTYPNGYVLSCSAPRGLERVTGSQIARFLLLGEGQNSEGRFFAFPASTMAITRRVIAMIPGFNPNYRRSEDSEFVLRAVEAGAKILGSSEKLVERASTIGDLGSRDSSIPYEFRLLRDFGVRYLTRKERISAQKWLYIREAWFNNSVPTLIYQLIVLSLLSPIFVFQKLRFVVFPRLLHERNAIRIRSSQL